MRACNDSLEHRATLAICIPISPTFRVISATTTSTYGLYHHFSTDPHDEVTRAQVAAAASVGNSSTQQLQSTIFAKILRKEIPADIVYEDDKVTGEGRGGEGRGGESQSTIFAKILRKEIPADILYEDDKVTGEWRGGEGRGGESQSTIFAKILRKEIPADIVYEDDKVTDACSEHWELFRCRSFLPLVYFLFSICFIGVEKLWNLDLGVRNAPMYV